MNSWKSNAKYGQNAEEGTIFELKDNSLYIHIYHIFGLGDAWFLNCPKLGVTQYDLGTEDFNEAVEKSKTYLKEIVQQIERDFYSFYSEEENEIVRY